MDYMKQLSASYLENELWASGFQHIWDFRKWARNETYRAKNILDRGLTNA